MPSSPTDRPAPWGSHDAAATVPPARVDDSRPHHPDQPEARRPESLADLSRGGASRALGPGVDRPSGPRLGAGDINWATGDQPVVTPAAVFRPTVERSTPTRPA